MRLLEDALQKLVPVAEAPKVETAAASSLADELAAEIVEIKQSRAKARFKSTGVVSPPPPADSATCC